MHLDEHHHEQSEAHCALLTVAFLRTTELTHAGTSMNGREEAVDAYYKMLLSRTHQRKSPSPAMVVVSRAAAEFRLNCS